MIFTKNQFKGQFFEAEPHFANPFLDRADLLSNRKLLAMPRKVSPLTILIASFFVLDSVSTAQSDRTDDRVTVQSGSGGRVSTFRGEILDFNRQRLELRTADGDRTRTFSSDTVRSYETTFSNEYDQALEAMEAYRFSEAYQLFERALAVEQRNWVRQEILAHQIQVATNTNQFVLGASLFTRLLQDEPLTRFAYRIPLMWGTQRLNRDETELARQWLGSDRMELMLIGASWLLSGPDRSQAAAKLTELSNDIEPWIAQLATSQLWRIEVPTATSSDTKRWSLQIDRMPRELRAGPLTVVGSAMAREALARQEVDETVTFLMRVPILYPQHFQESATALLESARLLEKAERLHEARKLYLELINGYASSKAMEVASSSPLVQELLNPQ